MDILSQYKQEHPETSREQKQTPAADEYGREYSGMIAFVMRLSGGRIRDARQANYALLGTALVIALAAMTIFFTTIIAPAPTKIYSPIAQPPALNHP